MKELLEFLIKGITGHELEIKEASEGEVTRFEILAPKELIGLIIGKGGHTIKTIRNLVRVKATLERKGVSIDVAESSS